MQCASSTVRISAMLCMGTQHCFPPMITYRVREFHIMIDLVQFVYRVHNVLFKNKFLQKLLNIRYWEHRTNESVRDNTVRLVGLKETQLLLFKGSQETKTDLVWSCFMSSNKTSVWEETTGRRAVQPLWSSLRRRPTDTRLVLMYRIVHNLTVLPTRIPA